MLNVALLSDRVVAEALDLFELEFQLEPTERILFRQRVAIARDVHKRADPDPGVEWETWRAARTRSRGLCELCGERAQPGLKNGLQREHLLSRQQLRRAGASWSLIHSPANIAAAGGACCNAPKGTVCLTAEELEWLWSYSEFGGRDHPDGLNLLFHAYLLESTRWHGLPIKAKVEADRRIRREPAPALGGLRSRGHRELADAWESAVESLWIGEQASDDNRELWGRASWQDREAYPVPSREAMRRCAAAWRAS